MNQRIIVTRYGGPEVLKLVEEPLRSPQKGEVRIKVQGAGVALADVMRRQGVYPMPPVPPFTPGYDAVGIVDAVGEDARQVRLGDRVGVFFSGIGGYSAYQYAPAEEVFKVPETLDVAQAVAVILNYVTAYQMLHRLARVAEGDSILIHGASGGVGTALLDLGRLAKLNMYGTASSPKHSVVYDFGGTPIDYRNEDFVEAVRRLAPQGIDAAFDPVGGSNWQRTFRTLNRKGRFVGFGYTSVLGGGEPDRWMKDWNGLAATNQTEQGNPAYLYSITSLRKEKPGWFMEDIAHLFSLMEKRLIHPLVSRRIPLADAAHAQQLLENSLSVGKIVLIVP